MQSFTNADLQNIFVVRSPLTSLNLWKYSCSKTHNLEANNATYDDHVASILYEFASKVTTYNHQISERNPSPISLNVTNFDVVIPLNTTYLYCNVNVAWIFYSTLLNIMVLSFTGTYNYVLSMADVNYIQMTINNYDDGMMVHGGFGTLYQSIQSDLITSLNKYCTGTTKIFITGFSLGGATSSICAYDLYNRTLESNIKLENIYHYTFGSPRVFNDIGARKYSSLVKNSYRILNGSDIIPNVPMPIMPIALDTTQTFTHIGELKYFDLNLGNYYDNHTLAYSQTFNK